jgi:hypothetical protein
LHKLFFTRILRGGAGRSRAEQGGAGRSRAEQGGAGRSRAEQGGAGREAEGVRGGAAGGAGEQVGGGAGQNARNPTLSLSGPPMPALYNATPGLNPPGSLGAVDR